MKKLFSIVAIVLCLQITSLYSYASELSIGEELREVLEYPGSEEFKENFLNSVNVQLDVKNIMQNPDLPNGCEITSLTICLNYKGVEADKCDLADNYLPKTNKWSTPADAENLYLGNPRNGSGWYCFVPCLCTTLEKYSEDKGLEIEYEDLTGCEPKDLYEQINNGNPCVIWGTLRWRTPYKHSNGQYSNLHCMVISGYTNDTVTITDPIYGESGKTISRSTFEKIWASMGSHALVIKDAHEIVSE